jgi:hypothetical protein
MKTSYFKFITLPEEIRLLNKIRSKERLDCVSQSNEGNYQGLSSFMNQKGQLVLFKTPSKSFVSSNHKRRAEFSLTNNSLNFSSIYIEDLDFPQFGYGYPNGKRFLSNGNPNPQYQFKNDGYLFQVNKDYSEIEILVIHEGRNHITTYYQKLIDGDFETAFQEFRRNAKPIQTYIGFPL